MLTESTPLGPCGLSGQSMLSSLSSSLPSFAISSWTGMASTTSCRRTTSLDTLPGFRSRADISQRIHRLAVAGLCQLRSRASGVRPVVIPPPGALDVPRFPGAQSRVLERRRRFRVLHLTGSQDHPLRSLAQSSVAALARCHTVRSIVCRLLSL